jgi:NADPH:quinone reductase-like Zn-dependent oxidoreductase
MLAAWYERCGPANEVLTVGEMEAPRPVPGEVLVRLRASGISPGDTKKRADWVKRVTTLSPAATWSSMTKRTLEKAAEYSATRRL